MFQSNTFEDTKAIIRNRKPKKGRLIISCLMYMTRTIYTKICNISKLLFKKYRTQTVYEGIVFFQFIQYFITDIFMYCCELSFQIIHI